MEKNESLVVLPAAILIWIFFLLTKMQKNKSLVVFPAAILIWSFFLRLSMFLCNRNAEKQKSSGFTCGNSHLDIFFATFYFLNGLLPFLRNQMVGVRFFFVFACFAKFF